MIESKNFTIVHVPKTGGTWIREVLGIVKTDLENEVPSFDNPKPHFGFARDPWDWYVSWYHFALKGSTTYSDHRESFVSAFNGEISFPAFVEMLTNPTVKFKEKLFSISCQKFGSVDRARMRVAARWLDSNKSYYGLLYELYLERCDIVGKLETAGDDLKTMLSSIGELDQNIQTRIDSTPPINVGFVKDHRKFYTEELQLLVASTSEDIIRRHGYEF